MPSITISVSASNFAVFSAAFLREMPVPQEQEEIDGVLQWEDEEEMIPKMVNIMTDLNWFKRCMIKYMAKQARRGAVKLRLDAAPINEALINDVIENA